MDTTADKLLELVRTQGLVRPNALAPLGIPRVALTRAVRRGQLERIGDRERGVYFRCDRRQAAGTGAHAGTGAPQRAGPARHPTGGPDAGGAARATGAHRRSGEGRVLPM